MNRIFILLIFFLTNASIAEPQVGLDEVRALKAKWASQKIESYSYTLKKGGAFGYGLYKIRVKNGVCKAQSKYVFGREGRGWKKDTCEGRTVNDLFNSVERQLQEGVLRAGLAADEEFSFISKFFAEPKTDLTDQDWYFEISKFKGK